MRITVQILKDKLLRDHHVTRRASELRSHNADVGYHKSLRMAEKEVSDIDHTSIINSTVTEEKDAAAIAKHIAMGRNYRHTTDG